MKAVGLLERDGDNLLVFGEFDRSDVVLTMCDRDDRTKDLEINDFRKGYLKGVAFFIGFVVEREIVGMNFTSSMLLIFLALVSTFIIFCAELELDFKIDLGNSLTAVGLRGNNAKSIIRFSEVKDLRLSERNEDKPFLIGEFARDTAALGK